MLTMECQQHVDQNNVTAECNILINIASKASSCNKARSIITW